MTRQWLTVQQVAHRLQVAEETVRRWLRAGELGGVNLGGKGGWRMSEEDFDRFLRERRARHQSRDERDVE
jgi:excisionase family DNA binding protein